MNDAITLQQPETAQRLILLFHGVGDSFVVFQRANQSVAVFTDAWIMINQTRIAVVTLMQNMMMGNADKDAMQTMLQQAKSRLAASEDGVRQNSTAFDEVLWLLGVLAVLVIFVIILSWVGLRRILLQPLHAVMHHINAIANGDLTLAIDTRGRNEMSQLAAGLHHMQQALIDTVSTVRDSAQAIYTGASEISAGSNNLSSRTEQQAASLGKTAASMEQLTATVKQNAQGARQAAQVVKSASETADKGGLVVNHVVQTMTEISDSSHKIADITNVINGIAFQTNILALNAAVEAARAGDQGRGFAVVAGEVRTLAQRSAQAAKEIKALIDNSVNRVNTGAAQVQEAGDTMQEIVGAVSRVTAIMGDIALASDEQSRGIDQVGQAVSDIDRVTQQNAVLVEESAAAAASLEEHAGFLQQAVAVFRINSLGTQERPASASPAPTRQTLMLASTGKAATTSTNRHWETF